jgi:hypothetical protein
MDTDPHLIEDSEAMLKSCIGCDFVINFAQYAAPIVPCKRNYEIA